MGASSSTSLVQENGYPFFTNDPHVHRTILNEEMSRRHIDRFDIPSRFSSRTVRGHGGAKCPSCSRRWTSHQASAKIDLKNLTIKVWRQKCQNCYYIVQMTFKEEEFRRMVNKMLDKLERQMRGEYYLSNHDDATPEERGPPHRKDLCEGCDWGAGDCRATSSASGGTSYHAQRYVGDDTTGRGGNRGGGKSSGGDSSSGLGIFGAVALGAVGLLAAGAAYALSTSNEEEEQKKRGEKK